MKTNDISSTALCLMIAALLVKPVPANGSSEVGRPTASGSERAAMASSPFDLPIHEALKITLKDRVGTQERPAKECARFITDSGTFGSNAESISNALDSDDDLKFLVSAQAAKTDLAEICPGFSRMNQAQQKTFWVWTLMGLAHQESRCGASKASKDPKGSARKMKDTIKIDGRFQYRGVIMAVPEGIFSLPVLRSRRGAGEQCAKEFTSEGQEAICALRMIRNDMLSERDGRLFHKKSWWIPFAIGSSLSGSSLKSFVRKFPLCANE